MITVYVYQKKPKELDIVVSKIMAAVGALTVIGYVAAMAILALI